MTGLPPGSAAPIADPKKVHVAGSALGAPTPSSQGQSTCRSATVSRDGHYRYQLERSWASVGRTMAVIGLNPSTADAVTDDATTRRIVTLARRVGCGTIRVFNLYAWRSSSPSVLRHVPDPVGPDNDDWIIRGVAGADLVIAAWGTHAEADRADRVKDLLRHHTLLCLGTTKDGHPRHPLYVPGGTLLQQYAAAQHNWAPSRPLANPVNGTPGLRGWGGRELFQRFCPCGADEISATPPFVIDTEWHYLTRPTNWPTNWGRQ